MLTHEKSVNLRCGPPRMEEDSYVSVEKPPGPGDKNGQPQSVLWTVSGAHC